MINISMDGVKDAVETARQVITPWQKANAVRQADLNGIVLQAEVEQTNAEALLSSAKVDREKAAAENDNSQAEWLLAQANSKETEAAHLLEQRDQLFKQIEEARAEIKEAQIELAVKIVERYAPDLHGSQKTDNVLKLLPILDRLTSTDLKVSGPSK